MSKLTLTLGATVAASAAIMLSLRLVSLSGGFGPNRWIVLAALASLWLKIYLQFYIFSNLRLDRQGYDFCVLTLGTALTTFAAEYTKYVKDGVGFTVPRASALFAIFVGALLAAFLTGSHSRQIGQAPPIVIRAENIKTIASFSVGFTFLMLNVGILLTR